jgi:hypothetical protein
MSTRMIQVRVVETDDRGERTELRCWNVAFDERKDCWLAGRADGKGGTFIQRRVQDVMLDVMDEAHLVWGFGLEANRAPYDAERCITTEFHHPGRAANPTSERRCTLRGGHAGSHSFGAWTLIGGGR